MNDAQLGTVAAIPQAIGIGVADPPRPWAAPPAPHRPCSPPREDEAPPPRRDRDDRSVEGPVARIGRLAAGVRPTRTEVVGVVACALTFTLWNAAAEGGLTFGAALFFSLFCLACALAGRPAARLVAPGGARDFPTVFLCGFLLLNSGLYLLAWISPFSIVVNALGLLALVLVGRAVGAGRASNPDPSSAGGAGLLALSLGLAAATLWSLDSIDPVLADHKVVVLRPFFDSYYHTCEIRMFRDARGAWTLHDLRMAGQPVWIYHHASYLVPALASAATGTDAYRTFGSFMIPAGELLCALAAYALVRSLWGGGAGLAAMAAVMLLPDGSHHGLGNRYLGFQWNQQIGPGGLYAIPVLAVAWTLVFAGCRRGKVWQVALGLVTAGLSVHYRAHLFVAAAPLIWVFPGLAFRGASWRWKGAWLAFAVASLVSAATAAQRLEVVPVIRLDGTSIKPFLRQVLVWVDHSKKREFYQSRFAPDASLLSDVAWGAFVLGYGVLGYVAVALAGLGLVGLGRRALGRPPLAAPEHVAFPFLVILGWLGMSLGLPLNTARAPQHGDELLHRPLVWAYFVAAAWVGGLGYRIFVDRTVRRSPALRAELVAAVIPLLAIPYVLGVNVQLGSERWGRVLTFRNIPRGMYECARYVRHIALPGEVAQDSGDDPQLLFSALCERPPYAVDYFEGKAVPALSTRIADLAAFRSLTDVAAIRRFALDRGIRWYFLQPQTGVAWPASLVGSPAFSWGGYRVFDFGPPRVNMNAEPLAIPSRAVALLR